MKRTISLILTLCLLVSLLPTGVVFAASSGDWKGFRWSLDDAGVLRIDGTGPMPTISGTSSRPWDSLKDQIKAVQIADGITTISDQAFMNCASLTAVHIPEGVTSIGTSAFNGCKNLAQVELPESLQKLSYLTFANCESLTEITVPEQVTELGIMVFSGCTNLTEVYLNCAITELPIQPFNGCTNVEILTLPDTLTTICDNAFLIRSRYCIFCLFLVRFLIL